MLYAHSVKGKPVDEWERLPDHLNAVGVRAADLAAAFGGGVVAKAIGVLHDLGKAAPEFQAMILRGEDAR